MIRNSRNKVPAWLCLIVFVLACGLPTAPALPTQTVEPLDAIIAATVGAARTQTAVKALSFTPTVTATATKTPTPTFTPATSTATFDFGIFVETSAPAAVETSDALIGGSGGSGSGGSGGAVPYRTTDELWSCTVVGKDPPKNATVKPNKNLYVSWTVVNTGTRDWPATGIDFVYDSGYRHEGGPIQDISRSVPRGGKITLRVLIVTPKKEDIYNVIWTLKVGNTEFCHMKITFEVKK